MVAPIELGLSTSSSASTGPANVLPEFNVDFGDIVAGEEASGGAGTSMLTGIVTDFAKAVALAMATKYLWKKIK